MMNKAAVKRYCIMFGGKGMNVHNESLDRSSVVTDRLKARIEVEIQEDGHFINDRLHSFVCING